MLRIGFTNKYHTLWDVDDRIEYDSLGRPYQKVFYRYLQNLSIIKEKAKDKAKAMGATNLNVDKELFGRNSSWYTKSKLFSELPKKLSPFFEFGKYNDKLIADVDDIKYIEWYFGETNNVHCRKIMLDNGLLIERAGEYLTIEDFQREKTLDMVKSIKNIDVSFDRNLGYFDGDNFDGGVGFGIFDDDFEFPFVFQDVKEMHYRDYVYYLPMKDGKGKRIKGKILNVDCDYIEDGINGSYLLVKKFKIVK